MQIGAHIPGLPVPRTALIGRERDLIAVKAILANSNARLLTLTGVGGCGKTRLAIELIIELAPDFPRRVWGLELGRIADSELLPIELAETLGVQEANSRASLTAIADRIGSQPALLLLDNCEHLIDACARFVDMLLSKCPGLQVLATSREPLHVEGERQYRVPPLDVPDREAPGTIATIAKSPAVQVFVSRAQSILPAFQLTPNNAIVVARICARLDGIPLALELAAAQLRVLGIEQILERLDDDFHLLTGGSRVAPTRHQTLEAALAWSDALLTDSERAVFRYLGVFAGEFQLRGVDALCAELVGPSEAVLEVLTSLVDKSLVVAVSEDYLAWYHLLEPLRHFALELLDEREERGDARARHAAYYVELAERSTNALRGPEQAVWLRGLEREHGNFRAALDWAQRQEDVSTELRLAIEITPFWEMRGHFQEGLQYLRKALARATATADPWLRLRAMLCAGRLSHFFDQTPASRFEDAEQLLEASHCLARELNDQECIAAALHGLGLLYRSQGDYERSIVYLEDALSLYPQHDEHGAALALMQLGTAKYIQGDPSEATKLVSESLGRLRPLGDLRLIGHAQMLLGKYARGRGDHVQAMQLIVEGLAVHQRLGIRWMATEDLLALVGVLLDTERHRQSVILMAAAQALIDSMGSPVAGAIYADTRAQFEVLRQEEWFEAAWTEGYELDPHGVVLAAQALLDEPEARDQAMQRDTPTLTPREHEVANLLAEGYTDRQIAEELFIAVGTVGVHVHNILQKLELRSRVQVAGWLKAQK